MDLPADDGGAAAAIAGDDLDLLVDLAGHAPGNRLPMLARRPARVQATWLDWFDTTGTRAIDWLISDAVHTPVESCADFTERLVLLPGVRFVYRPAAAIVPSRAPVERSGYVTFGSFNRHAKLTDDVVRTWSQVLAAVPGSRLHLRASAYSAPSTVAFVRERWARLGVPVERIDFAPYVPLPELHAAYAEIDVALDPFPFAGGVTTCDALAHGVPVVTLAGDRMVARQGAALLTAAGRPQWIAPDRTPTWRSPRRLPPSATLPQPARTARAGRRAFAAHGRGRLHPRARARVRSDARGRPRLARAAGHRRARRAAR